MIFGFRNAPSLHLAIGMALMGTTCAAQAPCDSLDQVDFTWQPNGAYGIIFSQGATASGASVLYSEWGFAGEGVLDYSYGPQPQYNFPAPGEYLVCLRATVQDDQGSCLSTACQLITVPEDPLCAGLEAAFTIDVQGGDIGFINQSQSGEPITGINWDFGDGATSTEAAPMHTYAGPGPFQACLTVSTATCTNTACNWIYLGPPDVPCNTLLQADIGVFQLEQTIAVFDQSIISGMNSSVTWDFGDGTTAASSPVLHTFQSEGGYNVCATVSLWGPLTPDTCTATACTYVSTYAATGISTPAGVTSLHAWPVPFAETCTVEGMAAPCRWELVDVLGQVHRSGTMHTAGPLTVEGGTLAPGPYLLRVVTAQGVETLRLVKGAR